MNEVDFRSLVPLYPFRFLESSSYVVGAYITHNAAKPLSDKTGFFTLAARNTL